jgi:hypothetical protein
MIRKSRLTGAIAGLLALSPLSALSEPISFGARDYIQHRANQPSFGAAVSLGGCVNHLQSNGVLDEPFVKTIWLTFDTPGYNQWIEIGCTKSAVATSIAIPNPSFNDGVYREGHYFGFSTHVMVNGQPQQRYYEGVVNTGSSVPSGTHRYKIERDITNNNRWCNAVNNIASYCITLNGISNYNSTGFITTGIESRDTSQTFTNNTTAENVWYRPIGSNPGFVRLPSMFKADNMATSRTWSSTYSPLSGTTPDRVTFKNQ